MSHVRNYFILPFPPSQNSHLNETELGMTIRNDIGGFVAARVLRFPGVLRVDEGEALGFHEFILN